MKAPLIGASLLLNVALLVALAARPSLAPAGMQAFLVRHFHPDTPKAPPPSAAKSVAVKRPKLWTALHTEDAATLIARLRQAGFPPNVIRALVTAEITARYDTQLRALQDTDPTVPFWKLPASYYMSGDKRLEEINRLYRERSKALRDVFKDEFFASTDTSVAQRRQFGDLPLSKIDALQRVEDDYNEMIAAVRAEAKGIILPEDREKLALLNREKRADLASILTAQELENYELRTSQSANLLRSRLAAFEPTEAEFRALFQAQLALNEKFQAGFTGIDQQTREAHQNAYHDQLRALLGDKRYAEYVRETSSDYQQLTRLVQRENLPRETPQVTYDLRNAIAAESNLIFDNAGLSLDAKRDALKQLAQNARNRILATLGPGAGPEYVRISDQWLTQMERGAAVSFSRGSMFTIVTDQGTMSFSGPGAEYRRLPFAPQPGR